MLLNGQNKKVFNIYVLHRKNNAIYMILCAE